MHSSRFQALHHSLKLRGHAAEMRTRHNPAEIALWQLLRAGQQGAWFRRQVVLLGSCIVDFYCPAARVIVEVDGDYHAEPARRRADARRARRLVNAGYRVVRVSAELVLADAEAALRAREGGAQLAPVSARAPADSRRGREKQFLLAARGAPFLLQTLAARGGPEVAPLERPLEWCEANVESPLAAASVIAVAKAARAVTCSDGRAEAQSANVTIPSTCSSGRRNVLPSSDRFS
jgi:very-short-patch-repair endonuclease